MPPSDARSSSVPHSRCLLGRCFSSSHSWDQWGSNLTEGLGCCCGAGFSAGSTWKCSGDAGELPCTLHPKGTPWEQGGLRGTHCCCSNGTSPCIGLDTREQPPDARMLPVIPLRDHHQWGPLYPKYPKPPVRDTAASPTASPSSQLPPAPLWGQHIPSDPGIPPQGQAPFGPREQHSGTLRFHPEHWEWEQNKRRRKGRARRGVERRGRCQQAASSHLLPARGPRGPPALCLMGTRLALEGGDTGTRCASASPT